MKMCLILGDDRKWIAVGGRRDLRAAVVVVAAAEVVAGHPQKGCGFVDHSAGIVVFEMLVRCRKCMA